MKIFTKNVGSNYLAKIVRLPKPEKIEGADKILKVSIDNQTIIVGNKAVEGTTYIFFPLETCLNRSFLSYTNCFDKPELNDDGKTKGFFRESARVRAVRLRGLPSEGYLAPISQLLDWLNLPPSEELEFEVGKEFDSIERQGYESVLLCEKYMPPMKHVRSQSKAIKKDKTKRFDRMIPGQFHFHVDTLNLKRNIHLIQPDNIITISEKLHGTSAIFSNILVKRVLTWREKIARFFGCKIQETQYDYVYSSRAVIKNKYLYEEDKKLNHWYKKDIWEEAGKKITLALEPGISIYCEIVGQMPGGGWIQKNYDYGTNPKEHEVYVYRITSTDPNGNVREFTTNQIKAYCNKYNLKTVPIHYYGKALEYTWVLDPTLINSNPTEQIGWFYKNFLDLVSKEHLEKPCSMCKNKVPAEGIVITVEKDQFTAFKLKSWNFLEQETRNLDIGVIDTELEESL